MCKQNHSLRYTTQHLQFERLQCLPVYQRGEQLLIRSGEFSLQGRKALQGSDMQFEVVIVDAAETKIERTPKKACLLLVKKKHDHLKTQVIVDQKDGRIICISFGKARQHDFKLFKKKQDPFGSFPFEKQHYTDKINLLGLTGEP